LHTMCSNNNAIPFSVRCLAWLGSWFGRGPPAVAGTPPPQASKPASQQHTHQCIRVCLFVCCFTYIYIYIYIYMLHITQTDRHRSMSVYSLSLSLYIVLVLVACTLSHHHHHTTRAVRVYVCVHLAPFRAMLQTSR
jgi:cytochrome bd-type quinol oxidase subunit 1